MEHQETTMQLKAKLTSLVKRFARESKGSIAPLFALGITGMMMAAGMGIDTARYVAARTQIQGALDAGSLAAASAGDGKSDSYRLARAQEAFKANMVKGEAAGMGATAVFRISDGKVLASATGGLDSAFVQLMGIDTMNMEVESEVNIPISKKAEIVLVLDYSGSMRDFVGDSVKYKAMSKAARDLVADLRKSNPTKIKFGLVPFSHHVYATLPWQYVSGQTGPNNWTGCTQDRPYPYNLSDSPPDQLKDETKWGQPQAKDHIDIGCEGYVPNGLKVRPLTKDFDAIDAQLAAMRPYAWTHIALGVEFGLQLLSPTAPYTEGASFSDKSTEKIMVVLTDGMQTEPGFGPGGVRDVPQGERNLEKLCQASKDKGITMMTVAYDLDDTTTRNRLKDCATDPVKNFFVASDGATVAGAFESIKTLIETQIYVSR
jgi:Flp pilus assembly protein TadG